MGSEGRQYRVALVGLGQRGYKTWFECLGGSSSIAISTVCDINKMTVDSFTSRHPEIPAYMSLEALLQSHKPDFAIVSVPNKFHAECISLLSGAGVPILKEKPVAQSVADFQQLAHSSVPIGVTLQRRWQPRFVHFKNFLPRIGKPLSIRGMFAGNYKTNQDDWRIMDNVGTFDDLGIHMLDIIAWLWGRPSSVLGSKATDGPSYARDRESHVVMMWKSSDIIGHLYVSEMAQSKEERLVVRGTEGSLHLNGNEITHFNLQGKQTFQMTVAFHKEDPAQAMCLEFGDFVRGASESFSTSINEMGDTLATLEAIKRSFVSNQLEDVLPISIRSMKHGATSGGTFDTAHTCPDITTKKFLLNTGSQMPGLGFGTRKPKKPLQTYEAVKTALETGYRHIDSAFRYKNEDQVGQAVRDSGIPREEIWITSKVDNSWHNRVEESINLSLQALGMDYVDLLLMHWPSPVSPEDPQKALPNWTFIKTWQDMQRVAECGRARNIGVSNFGIRNLQKLMADPTCYIVPAVNQIELHPYCPSNGLVAFCQQNGIHCTAYSPLAFGLAPLYEDVTLLEICTRRSKTPQQILIMWGIQRGTSVIPKSVTPERIAANFDLTGWELTPHELHSLSSLETRCRISTDDWLPQQVFWEEDN